MNTSLYIFVLGRNTALSLAELKAVFEKEKLPFSLNSSSYEVAIVESDAALDIEKLNKTLGGMVKIGKVISSLPLLQPDALQQALSIDLLQKIFGQREKVEFGISLYTNGAPHTYVRSLEHSLEQTAKQVKKTLESFGIRAHFPFNKFRTLSSASVAKNKILEKGAEILLIAQNDSLLVGKTLAVQEFEEFSARDYTRPERDLKSGIMPPKLARIMINLAQIPKNGNLVDPFCGSGTILQEALFLGYTHIQGSDISEKAVVDSQKNIEWLQNRFPHIVTSIPEITKRDVQTLSKQVDTDSIDAIVTEPFLGPTLHKKLDRLEAHKRIEELSALYIKAFEEFYKILKKDGVVVMIVPVFQTNAGQIHMNLSERIKKIGFSKEDINSNKPLLVGNQYDFVLREIVEFRK